MSSCKIFACDYCMHSRSFCSFACSKTRIRNWSVAHEFATLCTHHSCAEGLCSAWIHLLHHLFTSFVCCFSTQQIFSHSQFEHCFRVRCARACVLCLNWYWLSSSFHHYCVNVSIQTEGDACDLLFAYFARMNPKNFTLLQHELWAEATAAIVGRSSIIETLTHNTITSHHISPSVQLLIHMREKSSHSSVAVAKKKLFQICTSNSKCRWSAQAQKKRKCKKSERMGEEMRITEEALRSLQTVDQNYRHTAVKEERKRKTEWYQAHSFIHF